MKKQMILLIAAVTLAFTLNATTGNPMIVKIEKGDVVKSIDIRLANLQKKNTQITILDVEGRSWYFQNISHEVGFGTSFNLEGMPNNDYLIFVNNKNGQHFQAFSMEGDEIRFYDNQSEKSVKNLTASLENVEMKDAPKLITKVTSEKDQSLNVLLANLKGASTTIRLFTDSGTTVQTIKVADEQAYAKNWDMQNVANGNYFLYIKTGEATVVQTVKVKSNNVEVGAVQRLDF